ncbi:ABC transporter permease, partial [candidate division KSB1 bacterium]
SVIANYASSSSVPGRTLGRTIVTPEEKSNDESWVVSNLRTDDRFADALGLSVISGRNFSREFRSDSSAVLLNEAAVRSLGWEEPIGKTFNNGRLGVIGVVKDFHFASMHHPIEPVLFFYRQNNNPLISIRLQAGSIPEALDYIEGAWNEVFAGNPFEYSFLDEEFDQLHRNDENFGSLVRGFTLLAIIVACLGLYGLASHTTDQRTKEIGVRKVLGASESRIIALLSKDFSIWIVTANLIAWPAAWYFMKQWLDSFAYRTDLSVWFFLGSSLLAFIIASVTISYQSIKAARANPVDSLRNE